MTSHELATLAIYAVPGEPYAWLEHQALRVALKGGSRRPLLDANVAETQRVAP